MTEIRILGDTSVSGEADAPGREARRATLARLIELAAEDDYGSSHAEADDLLVKLVRQLARGHYDQARIEEIADAYERFGK